MNPPSLREICAKATPGPWEVRNEQFPPTNKPLDWRFIVTPNRALVVSVDTFSRTRWGETEEYSGCKIKEYDAQLIARFNPATALAVYEALEGVLRVADRKTDEFDAVRRALKLLDGRTEP